MENLPDGKIASRMGPIQEKLNLNCKNKTNEPKKIKQ
jgi:hypothetical protein